MFSLIFRTDFFKVKVIEISGNQGLSEEELLNVAGIPPGSNIFALRPWEVEKRLETFAEVKEAKVNKIFPYVVRIEIEERQPEAWVEVGDRVFCVDEEGVEISASSSGLVRIYLPENRKSLLEEALGLIKEWEKEFEIPLSAVVVESDRLFILELQNGIFIKCEGVNNLKRKSAILKPYLRDVSVRYLEVGGFDIRVGDDLIIVPAREELS